MNTKISEASQVLREMEAGAVAMLPDPAPDVIGGWAQRLRAALPRLHPQPAELAEQQGVDMADADTVALEIARRFIPVDSPGAHNEGQQRAALQVAIVGAINAALAATGNQQVGEVAVAEQHVLPLAREVLAAQCRSRLEFASERDIKTGRNDANWPELEIIADALRHPHYMERPEGGSPWKPAAQVGEVQGDALVTAEMVEAAENSRVAYLNAAAQYGSMSMDERHSRAMRAALETALAARQPVAQGPVGEAWIVVKEHAWDHGDGDRPTLAYLWPAEFGRRVYPSFDAASAFIKEGNWPLGFVAMKIDAQPAQGIDLGQFRDAAKFWRRERSRMASCNNTYIPELESSPADDVKEADRLLALIDSQRDAAPGVGS